MGAHCYLAVGLGVSSLRLRFLLRKVQMTIPPLPPTHTSLAGVWGRGEGVMQVWSEVNSSTQRGSTGIVLFIGAVELQSSQTPEPRGAESSHALS